MLIKAVLDSIYVGREGKWIPEATFELLTHIDAIEIKPKLRLYKSVFKNLFVNQVVYAVSRTG